MTKYSHKSSPSDILESVKILQKQKAQSLAREAESFTRKGMGDIPTPEEFASSEKNLVKFIEDFPIHLYPARGSQTFDVRRAVTLTNPTVFANLISFTIPAGVVGFWRSYALYTNTQPGTNALFDIRINGNIAFKYHGDSLSNFDKNLALGVDLTTEIDALQELQAGDIITIDCAISAPPPVGIPATLGARAKGWLITDRIELRGRAS